MSSKNAAPIAPVSTQSGVSCFHVDKEGHIDFPIFDKIMVKGLTVNEVSAILQRMSDGKKPGNLSIVLNDRIEK